MSLALAVDLGGTKMEAALIETSGRLVRGSRLRFPTGPGTDHSSLREATLRLIASTKRHPRWGEVVAAGVGSAGPVDVLDGSIAPINMPEVAGFPLSAVIQEGTDLANVTLRLDGTCITLAESWLGAARGVDNAIVMVVSTGVGGGIVSDGRLVRGTSGNAGHIGQILIHGVADNLNAATVEGLASGPHTVEWARQQGWTGISGEELGASAREGNAVAQRAVSRSATAVGVALANAATLLDLEVAVIGGGFASVSHDYVAQVQHAAQAHAINAYAARLRVLPAALGGEAPLVGAAALVHQASRL